MNMGRCYFDRFFEEEDVIWFISKGLILCLFQMNKKSGETQCLGVLPVDYQKGESYSAIGKIGNRIIIAPYYCKADFIEFDLSNYEFKKVPLQYDICSDYGSFNLVIKDKDSLFFIGCGNGVIVEVNDQYTYHFDWASGLELQIKNKLFAGCQYNDNILYLSIFDSNTMIELDMVEWNIKRIITMPFEYRILSQFSDGKTLWYIPVKGNMLVKQRINDNVFEQITLPLEAESERALKAIFFSNEMTIVFREDINTCFIIGSNGQIYEDSSNLTDIVKNGEIVRACINTCDIKFQNHMYVMLDGIFIEAHEQYIKKYAMDFNYDDIKKLFDFSTIDWYLDTKYERNRNSLYNFVKLCSKREKVSAKENQCGKIIYEKLF